MTELTFDQIGSLTFAVIAGGWIILWSVIKNRQMAALRRKYKADKEYLLDMSEKAQEQYMKLLATKLDVTDATKRIHRELEEMRRNQEKLSYLHFRNAFFAAATEVMRTEDLSWERALARAMQRRDQLRAFMNALPPVNDLHAMAHGEDDADGIGSTERKD